MARGDIPERQWTILLRLMQGPVTKKELEGALGVSGKTVTRDLNDLTRFFPIEGPSFENGYTYKFREGYRHLGLSFTTEESAALLFGKETILQSLEGVAYQRAFASAIEKIERSQRGSIKRDDLRLPEIYQSDFAIPHITATFQEELLQAALESKRVRIQYFSAQREKTTERVVEPFLLRLTMQGLHLIAYSLHHKDFRYFNVSRIQNLDPLEETFEPSQRRFDLERLLRESFGGLRSLPILHVRLYIRNPTAYWAKDLRFHHNQKRRLHPDGVEITFEAGGQQAIARRILSLGPDCEVLGPASLRNEVQQMAKKILSLYSPEKQTES